MQIITKYFLHAFRLIVVFYNIVLLRTIAKKKKKKHVILNLSRTYGTRADQTRPLFTDGDRYCKTIT